VVNLGTISGTSFVDNTVTTDVDYEYSVGALGSGPPGVVHPPITIIWHPPIRIRPLSTYKSVSTHFSVSTTLVARNTWADRLSQPHQVVVPMLGEPVAARYTPISLRASWAARRISLQGTSDFDYLVGGMHSNLSEGDGSGYITDSRLGGGALRYSETKPSPSAGIRSMTFMSLPSSNGIPAKFDEISEPPGVSIIEVYSYLIICARNAVVMLNGTLSGTYTLFYDL
jgi:hypothetical protein